MIIELEGYGCIVLETTAVEFNMSAKITILVT